MHWLKWQTCALLIVNADLQPHDTVRRIIKHRHCQVSKERQHIDEGHCNHDDGLPPGHFLCCTLCGTISPMGRVSSHPVKPLGVLGIRSPVDAVGHGGLALDVPRGTHRD